MEPIVKSLDEFLGERGLASPISDFMVDKIKVPHGLTQRKRRALEKEAAEAAQQYSEQRKAAVEEYNRLLSEGKVRAPSSIERLLKVAAGHEENQATQAARRTLQKRGIDWQTGVTSKAKEQNLRFTLVVVDREKDGLVDGAWMQDFTGTLEEATQWARETEQVNSDRISVAVVEDMHYTPFSNVYGAKRLDKVPEQEKNEGKRPSLDDIIKAAAPKESKDMKLNFEKFKNTVCSKGGVWASDSVYFTQFRDGYSASYKPSFPNHSEDDCAISYNWVKDEWRTVSSEQYAAEYNVPTYNAREIKGER